MLFVSRLVASVVGALGKEVGVGVVFPGGELHTDVVPFGFCPGENKTAVEATLVDMLAAVGVVDVSGGSVCMCANHVLRFLLAAFTEATIAEPLGRVLQPGGSAI